MEDSSKDSVVVRIPDRNILEQKTAKATEGHRSPSTKWAALTKEIITILEERKEVVEPRPESAFFSMWDHNTFTTVCAIAVMIDPLFLYIALVDDKLKCLHWDQNLAMAYTILRSTTDLFYAIDFFFSIRKNSKKLSAMIAWPKKNYQISRRWKEKIPSPKLLLQFGLCFGRFFVALPIPQVITYNDDLHPNFLMTLFTIQYTERVCLIYIKLKQRPDIKTGIGRWLKAILDFFPFILAAHLFGAMWYNLALERQLNCWIHACLNVKGCDLGRFFDWNCINDSRFKKSNKTVLSLINKSCPIHSPNATIFDFGIYLYALQSEMARSKNIIPKMLQGFWWGLRNLSSFGSNLQTSFYWEEIIFATFLSISGIVLFLIYLNERLQEAKRISNELKLTRKMQMINPEIDLWLSKNDLLNDKDIRKWIRKSVRQQLEEHKDVVVQNLNIFSVLPIIHRRYIMSFLRLASLKKVPMLEKMKERVLKEICNHLEPMTYTKNLYIIREGEPLWNMLFITQGTALTYKASRKSNVNMGASTRDSSICDCLQKGDFYGEELLNWAFIFASLSELPISTRTVISQTKLEAFSINVSELKSVVSKFRLHFSLMNRPHLERTHLAASFLQLAWRTRVNRKTVL